MARKRDSGLTEEQAKRLAEKLQPFFKLYSENQTQMAKAWGISQPQLGQILNAKGRGAGVAVLCRIREKTRMSLDELLGLDPFEDSVEERVRVAIDKQLESRVHDALADALEKLEKPRVAEHELPQTESDHEPPTRARSRRAR